MALVKATGGLPSSIGKEANKLFPGFYAATQFRVDPIEDDDS
jgi:hypothetical protein